MTAAGFPDTWDEVCLVGIQVKGGSEIQYAGIIGDISGLDFGEKDVEVTPTLSGGRLVSRRPQGEESITLKVYPISADLDGSGVVQLFHPQISDNDTTGETTDPISVENTRYRNKYRLCLLWASTFPSGAGHATPANASAYRMYITNAYMTSYKPSLDDKQLSAEVTFKWAPFTKTGTSNKTEESTDGTSALGTATAFTT